MSAEPARASLSEAPQPLPASVHFGRFQLVARLGKGGMGDVFLAVAGSVEGANKLLVIKRLRETFAEDPSMRAQFLAEGKLAARLNHPNVIQTYEVGQQEEVLYLCMEFLEGQPLSQLDRRFGGEFPDPVIAARIMSEALAGLHYAHDLADYDGSPLGLVHRDVSPHNVFVTYDGVTKVLDFGIAKVTDEYHKTQEGVLKGKVAYMSPEQVSGEVDRRSDVFSAGIVLWEFLARKRLMAQGTTARTLYQLLHGPPVPRLSTIMPRIHPMLDDVVARALRREPRARYQTAQEMRDALEKYIAATGRYIRQEDLAKVMKQLFGERREQMTQQVRAFMLAATEAGSTLELPAISSTPIHGTTTCGSDRTHYTPTNSTVVSVPEPSSIPADTASHTLTSGEETQSYGRTEPRRSRTLLVVGGALVVAAGAVALGMKYYGVPRIEMRPPSTPVLAANPETPVQAPSTSGVVIEPVAPPPSGNVEPVDSAEASSDTPAKKRRVGGTRWTAPTRAQAGEPVPTPANPSTSEPAPAGSGKRKFRTEL